MELNDDIIDRLQADVAWRLRSLEWFEDVTVLVQTKGDIESDVLEALGTLNEKSGKYGLVAVVILPSAEGSEANIPGPRLELQIRVQIIESVLFNRGDSGTGKTASQGVLRVLHALHHFVSHDVGVMYAARNPVVPLPVADELHSYAAQLIVDLSICGGSKVSTPEFAQGASVSLSCATPDAEIYYTTDGSYPSPENENATLYTTPITPADMTIRASAYKEGMLPSDVQVAIVEV